MCHLQLYSLLVSKATLILFMMYVLYRCVGGHRYCSWSSSVLTTPEIHGVFVYKDYMNKRDRIIASQRYIHTLISGICEYVTLCSKKNFADVI